MNAPPTKAKLAARIAQEGLHFHFANIQGVRRWVLVWNHTSLCGSQDCWKLALKAAKAVV